MRVTDLFHVVFKKFDFFQLVVVVFKFANYNLFEEEKQLKRNEYMLLQAIKTSMTWIINDISWESAV